MNEVINELKKQLPLLSIIVAVLFSITAITYQIEPVKVVFYVVLLFCPCVMLEGRDVFYIDKSS